MSAAAGSGVAQVRQGRARFDQRPPRNTRDQRSVVGTDSTVDFGSETRATRDVPRLPEGSGAVAAGGGVQRHPATARWPDAADHVRCEMRCIGLNLHAGRCKRAGRVQMEGAVTLASVCCVLFCRSFHPGRHLQQRRQRGCFCAASGAESGLDWGLRPDGSLRSGVQLHRWMLTPSVTSTAAAAVDIGVLHSAVLSVSAGRAREGALQISLIKNPRLSAHDDPLARAPSGELSCHVGSTVPSRILRNHTILEFHLHAI